MAHASEKALSEPEIVIMVFSDFSCPYCSKAAVILNDIRRLYPSNVAIVFKHFPLKRVDSRMLPHEALLAAADQGMFWEMHDILFSRQQSHLRPDLEKYAAGMGIDMPRFRSDLDQHRYKDVILQDISEARALRVKATPTFFIEGLKLEGLQSLSTFQQIIDHRINKK